MRPAVTIVAGAGAGYGTGHLRRMRAFARWLRTKALGLRFVVVSADRPPRDLKASLYVVDARDMPLDPFLAHGPVIALDNRHRSAASQAAHFHNTIPHPQEPLAETLRHVLIAPELIALRQNNPTTTPQAQSRTPRGVAIYAPSSQLANRSSTVFGQLFPDRPIRILLPQESLPAPEFYRQLRRSEILVTHFGISMLEAWFLGVPLILWSIGTPIHDELGRFLEGAAGIPFLEAHDCIKAAAWQKAIAMAKHGPSVAGPGERGYEILWEKMSQHL